MKKICFILACLVLPLLMSCERNYYEDNLFSADYDIRTSDWTSTGSSYMAVLDVREITREVCRTGSVQCFLVYDDGSQAPLPMQRYLSYEYTTDAGTTETGYYSKMIDFEYTTGTVNIFYQMSDFYYETRPEAIRVRVIVHY